MEIKIDFFKISNEGDNTVDAVLREISRLNYEQRLRNIYKIPTRIQDIINKDDLWLASIIRIRMENEYIPMKAKLNGEVEEIDLEEDEGIGETVSFLYDPQYQVLLVQRNRYGIGAAGIKRYLERMGKFAFHMEPIIELNALEKLKKKNVIRRFEFKLIRTPEMIRKDIEGKSGFQAINLLDEFGSYYVDVRLGFDNSKQNRGRVLNKESILRMANRILGKDEEFVEKFRVYGNEGDEETPDFVDLIQDRIHEVLNVNVSRTNRMTFEWMSDLLMRAYNARRREIILRYIEE